MAKYKVTVPNKKFAGERFGLKFENGEATGELDKNQVKGMKLHGYKLEEVKEEKKEAPKKAPARKTSAKKTEDK